MIEVEVKLLGTTNIGLKFPLRTRKNENKRGWGGDGREEKKSFMKKVNEEIINKTGKCFICAKRLVTKH